VYFRETQRENPVTNPAAFAALLDCAHSLADVSAKAIRPYFRTALPVDNKGGTGEFDPVTAADRAAERAILKYLAANYPDHGVVGEEYGAVRPEARYRWVIDPIDGTRAFIMGLPTWGTLIGLLDADAPILGVMNQPFTGERFFAGKTAAYIATADGKSRRIKTRRCSGLAQAVFSATHPDLFATPAERRVHARIKATARMTRYGGDCYAYCLLAAGHIDLIVEPGLKSYDIAALIPIIERAGGIVTTWEGGPAQGGGDIIAAGDKELHGEVLELIGASRGRP
jgi:myo-inositol-1(or 4)-monophosphatase